MATKDFSKATGAVADMLANVTEDTTKKTKKKTRVTHSDEDVKLRAKQKAEQAEIARLNFAISPENHYYVRLMSQLLGISQTTFINQVIEKSRQENSELFATAERIKDKFK